MYSTMNFMNEIVLLGLINDMPLATMFDAIDAAKEQGDWQPANGGTETPFMTRNKRRLLYCWQPTTGRHAYLDMDSDHILTDQEARLALGTY